MCKLSVIMPVYNEEKQWLKKSIESILFQTFKDFEFIILLDNPNNTKLDNLIKSYAENDNRIKYVINNKNYGLVKTLNKGLDISKGELIARMDADDIADSQRFEKQVEFLSNNSEIGLVGTNWKCVDENDDIIFVHGKLPTKYKFIKENIKYNNMFLHPSWMFRKNILKKLEGYREITYSEDFDFITRCITSNIKVSNINDYLMLYRVRKSSISLSKSYEQYINSEKSIEYMKQRYKNGYDNFHNDQNNNKRKINIKEKEKYLKATELFLACRCSLKNKKVIRFIIEFSKSFFISKHRAKKNINIILFKIKLAFGNK